MIEAVEEGRRRKKIGTDECHIAISPFKIGALASASTQVWVGNASVNQVQRDVISDRKMNQ
ncbi:hypothetical protein MASR1M36_02740 [Candidatus Cloacimonadaceae bacterium]